MNLFSYSLMFDVYVDAVNIFGRMVHYVLHMSELRYFQFTCAFAESSVETFHIEAFRSSDGQIMEIVSRNFEVHRGY